MKITIDAMGGDKAPVEIIRGAIIGARLHNVGIIFTGQQEIIEHELNKSEYKDLDIQIEHTDQYLVEGEPSAYALREKRKASILIAAKMVKEGKADAAISMGPTGGVVTAALMILGTMEGLSRPVFGGPFLGFAPDMVLMDMGGNLDCKPYQLLDFAVIGNVYAQKIMNINNPSIALLNVGVEEGKGNELTKEAYKLLKNSGLNFIGNFEGNDIVSGRANVIICDGFDGNIIAKFCEGMGAIISDWLKNVLKHDLNSERLDQLTRELLELTVRADTTGGGPVWGANGLIMKGHGRSGTEEMIKTIENTKRYIEMDIIHNLKDELSKMRARISLIKI